MKICNQSFPKYTEIRTASLDLLVSLTNLLLIHELTWTNKSLYDKICANILDISSFLRNFWTWWRNGHLTCITSRQLSLPRSIDSTEIGTTQCCWERSGSCELLIVTSWKISLKCNQHLFSDMKKKPNIKKERNWKQIIIISQLRADFTSSN